ncbi:hypothetical protein [Embleya sp. NBC_00896]|uniref:hypothetical protein n=1 Tax=Embleya sp. NBC_00896 TaxID=2975961 RepID=UPI0038684AB3|nr:hypothetical protein OG928_22315 [Embleya sp. NBC_00896]
MRRIRHRRVLSMGIALGAFALTAVAVPVGSAAPLTRHPAAGEGARVPAYDRPLPGGPSGPPPRGVDVVPAEICPEWPRSAARDAHPAPGLHGPGLRDLLDRAQPHRRAPGSDPARVDCPGPLAPGTRTEPLAASPAAAHLAPRPPDGRPPKHPAGNRGPGRKGRTQDGESEPRLKPPGAERRGAAARRAVHDGPMVAARRAITDHIASTGSAPVLPLSLAAGALVLIGGLLVVGTRHRRG